MKSPLLGAVSACIIAILSPNTQAVPVSGQGTWETTLQGRDLDGNAATFEAYYDTALDITWLATASNRQMDWRTANSWATLQNPFGSGIRGWRLPTVNPVDGTTADDRTAASTIGTEDRGHNISAPGTLYAGSTASELAHLFYNTLGNKANCDPLTSTAATCAPQAGYGLTNTGPLRNLRATGYWTETIPFTNAAWVFGFNLGAQDFRIQSETKFALAVRSGDISTVPVPAALWLFGSGLMGLVGVAINKTKRLST